MMIEYKKIETSDKEKYECRLNDGYERGCEYTFANVYMWGDQKIADVYGNLSVCSRFGRKKYYMFPIGEEDKTRAIDAIIADSLFHDEPCIISGVSNRGKKYLEENYEGRFEFTTSEGSYDYIYDINDLCDLMGRKYASKRNHLRRFHSTYPDVKVAPVTKELFPKIRRMLDNWFAEKTDSFDDFELEKLAIERALENFSELCLEGIVLLDGDEVLAFTVGSRMSEDTVDVHFEKAKAGVDGAYAAINREFAAYIRDKFPSVRYLDREEDMGIPGLRKAKESYNPCRRIVKYKARLLERS